MAQGNLILNQLKKLERKRNICTTRSLVTFDRKMNLWKILLNYLLLNLSTRRTVIMSCSQLYKKYGQWRLITTVITVFEPGILLPVIQVQFYYVISVCSGYLFGISCTRCYFVVPCKVITYIVWCAWTTTFF